MMWMIGGIAGVGMLLMFGKQIFQTIKNNKMQKMMMDNISKAQQQAMANINIPGMEGNPLANEVNQMVKKEAFKGMNEGTRAVQDKLAALQKEGLSGLTGKAAQAAPGAPGAPVGPAAPAASDAAAALAASGAAAASTAPGAAGAPAAPAAPGKRPLRKASEVRAAAGITEGTGVDITVKPSKQSMNDVIPAKYKRWRKPGTSDSSNK